MSKGKKFKPMSDRILVKRVTHEEKSSGGIIIPDSAKEKPHEGIVVAIGNGKLNDKGERHKPELNEGDRVYFARFVGSEIDLDGQEHLILKEDDVLGVLY